MKNIITITILLFFIGCCPSKETSYSNTTYTDSTLSPNTINDTLNTFDDELNFQFQQLYNIISLQQYMIDSLQSLSPEIITIKSETILPSKPLRFKWHATKITQRGDSIWVEFRYDKGNGKFDIKIVPAKLNILVPHTETTNTVQYEEPWYSSIWNGFKDFILGGIIFILIIFLTIQKIKK
jgi:hypothetical protein